ncbi:MAG: polyphosphate polymerase domain-containing protein [Candidatus Izemoplasmatales bacterium]|nr:polyphosphate polymerase domain-containing protein [Candidatus Izemoplasmatales bacterium]MDD3865141.1 polyphosphate polymerase domain-containing protein [Candidatus Izemoplasmatales bacterium]
MDIQTFNRYEEKYIVTEIQKQQIIKSCKCRCDFDPFCSENNSYRIYNLYFDTKDNNVIRQSISCKKFKEKLRMRCYKFPILSDDMVFIEIKKKAFGRINKRRISLSRQEAFQLIDDGTQPHFDDYESQQVLAEINYFLQNNRVIPSYFITYERMAMTFKNDNNIRITFDSDIVERNYNLHLDDDSGIKLLKPEQVLMEIKTDQNYPLWLVNTLSQHGVYSQSFSKVGAAYSVSLRGVK